MAAAWTACTKFELLEKKLAPERMFCSGVFLMLFGALLKGVFGKSASKWMVFCGDFCGESVVEGWFLDGAFLDLKIFLS